jgi:hypothetical protein
MSVSKGFLGTRWRTVGPSLRAGGISADWQSEFEEAKGIVGPQAAERMAALRQS